MSGKLLYRPLSRDRNEIRILQIDRILGDQEAAKTPGVKSRLQCSMHLEPLGSGHSPFFAVSYCWGKDQSSGRSITIDGHDIDTVPNSAVMALESLVRKPGERVWIDAICIDQGNNSEKSWQVGMMKEIYSAARKVRILLGSLASDTTARAIRSARDIEEQCHRETNGLENLSLHLYGADNSGFRYSEAPLPTTSDWEALRELYSLQWFTRLWIVQEVALARKATCCIPSTDRSRETITVDAETVTLGARWMVHRRYVKHFSNTEVQGIENASSMYRPTMRPLSNQLRRMHRQQCHNPRDRVYGLLGLLRPEVAAAISPDYNLPLAAVYAQAVRVALQEDKSLYILGFLNWYVENDNSFAGRLKRVLGRVGRRTGFGTLGLASAWPSWVPRFHGSTESDKGSSFNVQWAGKPTWPLEARGHSDSLALSIRGSVLGRVASCSGCLSRDTLLSRKQLSKVILSYLRTLERIRIKTMGSQASVRSTDSVILALKCGKNALNSSISPTDGLRADYADFIAWCEASSRSGRKGQVGAASQKEEEGYPRFWHDIWHSQNRRLFVTKDGVVGMGPSDMRSGDSLCILSGSQVPFVLRGNGSKWRLVGDAYCRTVMKPLGDDGGDDDENTAEIRITRIRRCSPSRWFEIE
ncbi:hypothetical protein NLU13_2866 [Sarocladium strictum]|uniref:Heterokaryon incompatibility domain-containing protein n=1 Tax=Sarocladium strictum TaxID=5046 RepID=A0AA39GLN7_SARSR|nr:hypothetical protein NLU13_2866 [Sarocladium strictum]